MSVLIATDLAKSYGPLDVFQGVNLRIEKGDRIGLVGPNGEGKTTLLRLLAGLDAPSAGSVQRMRGLTIGYLPQEPPPPGQKTLWEDVAEVFAPLLRQAAELHRLEELMANPATYERALAEYGPKQAAFEAAGGYTWEVTARQVLTGLGFLPAEHHLPLAHLSGGQRTRGLLARLLLARPDLLLLDEPTNHLDLQAVEWLEGQLLAWPGSMVVVSHDRYFLDRVATRIWELADGRLEVYRGNYTHYTQQRAARLERLRREWERQQEFVAKEEEFIRRNIAGQNTRQAQGRRTRLERLRAEGGLVERPHERHTIRLHMDARLRSGNLVLSTQGLAIGYRQSAGGNGHQPRREEVSGGYVFSGRPTAEVGPEDLLLFRCEDLELKRGERVALIGPNGAGKTTFVKTLLGQVPPLAGRLRVGASVRIGYLAQVQADLDPDQTVLDAILQKAPRMEIGQARSYLARFLFLGDDVFKPISALSGGQRSRVALARLALEDANFLVLDEPTNHLDIPSQEVLEEALRHFNGTVLLVTHDRYLVDALATQVWAVDPERRALRAYPGNYTQYLAALAVEREAEQARPASTPPPSAQEARERARAERRQRKADARRAEQLSRLEDLIQALEQRLAALGRELEQASAAQATDQVHRLGLEYQAVDQRLQELIEEWSQLAV
ncbi:MAG: ABC-F family ATP-binding cassette domain-containing protein [Caldilineales bacterium]|nr:ABC-F family ATP-binding cassette domain-containing protein [Caldilineales bacterium]MDW8317537.1 ABC-F family ATP-binding cassette domain-containing protein [Anaerolineae bacterium]